MGTKNLAVPSILKCQTGLGKAAESVHFWHTADEEEAGERWVQRTGESHPQNPPGFGCEGALGFLSGPFSGSIYGAKSFPRYCKEHGHRTKAEEDRDVRRHRRMPRFTVGQGAASKAQTAPILPLHHGTSQAATR